MQPQKKSITPLPQATPVASASSAAVTTRSDSPFNADGKQTYPYQGDISRLEKYQFNALLFDGNHFDAFKIKVDDALYSKQYSRLRYVVNNFPGLISKICADMLFGKQPRITLPEGSNHDDNSEWLENWIHDVDLYTTLYESAMTASYKGDAVLKLRVGTLNNPKNPSIILEQVQPDFFFAKIDPLNVSANPSQIELSFVTKIGKTDYVRKEIHTAGKIENELWELKGSEVIRKVSLSLLDESLPDEEETGVDRLLVVHVPNWKDGRDYYGNDDYRDLDTLFYAINNRITKIDNILDKHSDPILAIPEGVLDEEGNVRREHLNLFEKGQDGDKPEYVVWNAQLQSAFDEVDRLMQSLYMFSEISPDAFGNMEKGAAASGRALKYRLMRTVAKINRKKIYFDRAIKEIVYVAQLLAEAHNIKALDADYKGAPDIPSIEWQDPIPQDSYEQAQEEELRLASGNQSLVDSIINIDGLTEEQAEEKVKAIEAEAKATAPVVPTVQIGEPAAPDTATPNGAKAPSVDPFAKDIKTPKTTKAANASL